MSSLGGPTLKKNLIWVKNEEMIVFSKCWVFSIGGLTCNVQGHNIPMETTTSGYYIWAESNDYIITKYSYKSRYLFSGQLKQIWSFISDCHWTSTGQGVSSEIIPRLYLNVVIWSLWVRTLLRYCNSKSIDFKCTLNLILSWSQKDRHNLSSNGSSKLYAYTLPPVKGGGGCCLSKPGSNQIQTVDILPLTFL